MKNLEKSRPDFMKHREKHYFEKLASEIIHEVGDLKRAHEMRIDEFSRNDLE